MEEELKEEKEFDELIKKGKKMNKIEFLRLTFLSGCEVGKRQRNTEVETVIEKLDWNEISFEEKIGLDGCGTGHFYPNKKELLQKLGLGEGE